MMMMQTPASTITTTPAGVPIQERAMLVDFTAKAWTNSKVDKAVSDDVARQYNTTSDSGRYTGKLLHPKSNAIKAYDAIKKIAGAAYADHMAMTLPWLNNGARILPSDLFFSYDQKMRAHAALHEAAVQRLAADWDDHVAEQPQYLNGLFKWGNYPTRSEISGFFALGYNVMPLPEAKDFRVDLGALEIDRVRRQIENATQQALHDATQDVYGRIHKVVGHMATSLREYRIVIEDGKQKAEHPFRDSLVENVRELAALLPALNVTQDVNLSEIVERIQSDLTRRDAETLRVSQNAREEVAAAAESILNDVSELFA